MSSNAPELSGDVVYAGFLRRWAALFLDQLILTSVFYLLFFVALLAAGLTASFENFDTNNPPPWFIGAYLGLIGLYYVMAGLYYALMESSAAQATVGKMALGIKVTDRDGNRLTLRHALGRWAAAALSYLTLYIGFIVAAFTERKQALHDLIAGTLVVDKWAYTDTPERQQRGLSGCLIAFLIAMILMLLLFFGGMLAAIAIPAYQDYVQRARVAGVIAEASVHKLAIAEAALDSGDCPSNESDGFRQAESYAGQYVQRIDIGELESGGCGLIVWLADSFAPGNEPRIVFEFDRQQQSWTCVSSLPDRQLPASCR